MRILNSLLNRFSALFHKMGEESQMDEELRFHLEEQVARYKEQGLSDEEARRQARIDFGSLESVKEKVRDERTTRLLEETVNDLRYALRTLSKHWSFTLLAILTLALGIGASVSVFSVVRHVLLKELPYPDPEELVVVWERNLSRDFSEMATAPGNYFDWREQNTVFQEMASFDEGAYLLELPSETQQIRGARVTASLFPLLRAKPLYGRVFGEESEGPDGELVAVVSYRFWRRHLDSDPTLTGKTILIRDRQYKVIGVMPQGFTFPPPISFESEAESVHTDVWIPFALQFRNNARGAHFMTTIARLKEGVNRDQAAANLNTIAANLENEYPATNTGWDVTVNSLSEEVLGESAPRLWLLLGAVLMVLLVGCVNVANLLLARGAFRRRELAVRLALGAGRLKILRQLLIESLCLGLLGGGLGLLLALWSMDLLLGLAPSTVYRLDEVRIDLWVTLFAVGLSLVTGVVFGILPGFESLAVSSTECLREGGREQVQSGRSKRIQSTLVVAEVALSIALLVGGALMLQSLMNLLETNSGIESRNVLTASVRLPQSAYDSNASLVDGFYRLEEALNALPEVKSAGFTRDIPLANNRDGTSFDWEGRAPFPPGEEPSVQFTVVTPGYFPAFAINAIEGRLFSYSDTAESEPVLIVNQEFVRRYGQDLDRVVGRQVQVGANMGTPRRIVGIVENVRTESLRQPPYPTFYAPYFQLPFDRSLGLVVRSFVPAEDLLVALQNRVRQFDQSVALYNPKPMEEVVRHSLQGERFLSFIIGVFSALALLLACVGVFGVVSYSVASRRQEMGIRMVLGARRRQIMVEVLSSGTRLALLGILLGLGGAIVVGHFLSRQLYGVEIYDPTTLVLVPLLMLVAVTLACLIPAWRAARTDPTNALRAM